MRTVIVLFLSLAVIGCESDFQRCMNTELPRAKQLLGVDDQAEKITALTEMAERLETVVPAFEEATEWHVANTKPTQPEERDSEEFLRSLKEDVSLEEFKEASEAWWSETREILRQDTEKYQAALASYEIKKNEFYLQNGKEAGFSGDTYEEMYGGEIDPYVALYEEISALVRDRALELGCWESGDCSDPLGSELQAQASSGVWLADDPIVEIAPTAVAESLKLAIKKLSDAQRQSKELATIACNSNGLYE